MSDEKTQRAGRVGHPNARGKRQVPPEPGRRYFPLTDLGNAERLVQRHGSKLRYCTPLHAWFIWDGVRWKRDDVQRIMGFAGSTARAIHLEAADADDKDQAKAISDHAIRSESASRLWAMVRLCEAQSRVAIRPDELDTDPWLLTVLNGTIDLRRAELMPHDPRHLITKLAPVSYLTDARSDLWDSFLRDVTGDDKELMEYLQRAVGYSLTGRTTEHAVFFVYGPPATGKSRFTTAIKDMLGDYAIQTAFETFLAKRWAAGRPTTLRTLRVRGSFLLPRRTEGAGLRRPRSNS
jgi:putative DNA primase/helicase